MAVSPLTVVEFSGKSSHENGKVYYQRSINIWDGVIPEQTPQDLLTENERKATGIYTGFALIRTWYGAEGLGSEAGTIARASADAAYLRLYRKAILCLPDGSDETGPHDGPGEETVAPSATFDRDSMSLGVVQHSTEENVVQAGVVPSFLISALMHTPDSFDGISGADWRDDDQERARDEEQRLSMSQHFLVLVADRKACEEGWMLQVAVTHKGHALPYRVRVKASETKSHVNQWLQLGNAIDAGPEHVDTTVFAEPGNNGWDEH